MGSKKGMEILARIVIERQGMVLLCRNRKGNYYYLPGGHVEQGESARVAAEREMIEECGERVVAKELVLVAENQFGQGKKRVHEYTLVFHATGALPEKVLSREDYIDFAWVDPTKLSRLDVRPGSIKKWLRRSRRAKADVEFLSEGL